VILFILQARSQEAISANFLRCQVFLSILQLRMSAVNMMDVERKKFNIPGLPHLLSKNRDSGK